uniref:Proline-rich protein PRCC n=1 Tax=Stomoxys calcitrans TaxID=35570 RepID=A0A1I8P1V2_STOCA
MSLVAYDDSSDGDSEYEDNKEPETLTTKPLAESGQISDDDDEYLHQSEEEPRKTFSLSLPKPHKESTIQEIVGQLSTTFSALPTPKTLQTDAVEEDDEYLHKKDKFVSSEVKPPPINKGPVKISIPSLKDFQDVQEERKEKAKINSDVKGKDLSKGSGLLSILPKAKSERDFSKTDCNQQKDNVDVPTKTSHFTSSLVPDTVKYRRPAYSTEGINDDVKPIKKITPQRKSHTAAIKDVEEDEDDDNNGAKNENDFFSLSNDNFSLPDICSNEINMMVAKKAAKIAEASKNYLKEAESNSTIEQEVANRNQLELEAARKRYQESQLDSEATQALVGSSAKRRKNHGDGIQIVDINSDQILPDREEWMRNALASSTTYQPTGVLVDEEPQAGTRRKHQITYLAHKAKANEAELQAMWAANRQNRRATQSKYGF